MSTRSNRHVIVEGPDGAGKSTVVKHLSRITDTPVARRISDSIQGVKGKDLQAYVDQDMGEWANYASADPQVNRSAYSSFHTPRRSYIYDRYPLISEPIYGLHVRKSPQPAFMTMWYRDKWQEFLAHDPLVIWCLPPYDEVAKHVHPGRDMDGVWSNLLPLYRAYTFAALTFPGTSIMYDYTRDEPGGMSEPGDIVAAVARHFEL